MKEITAHMGPGVFDYEGWMRIATVHGGRNSHSKIRAVKEGTVVPVKNALMTMMGTDDLLPWVPSFVETILMKVWAPTTVSTTSLTGKNDH
jgi:nicotinamide phosphoribosyltransferase